RPGPMTPVDMPGYLCSSGCAAVGGPEALVLGVRPHGFVVWRVRDLFQLVGRRTRPMPWRRIAELLEVGGEPFDLGGQSGHPGRVAILVAQSGGGRLECSDRFLGR